MTINIITTTLPASFGGRTKSLLSRTRIFNEAGMPVRLVTTNYRDDYEAIYTSYRQSGKVLANTTFANSYDYYKAKQSSKVKPWQDSLIDLVGDIKAYTPNTLSETSDKEHLYYEKEGERQFLLRFRGNGRIMFFALYEPGCKDALNFYHVHPNLGYVHRVVKKRNPDQFESEQFLAPDGTVYFTQTFDDKGRIKHLTLKDGEETVEFSNQKAFFAYYYKAIFGPTDQVICDARALDQPLMLQEQVAQRIFQLHNTHLVKDENKPENLRPGFKYILGRAKLTDKDRIVCLTARQRDDILALYPNLAPNLVVIGHSTQSKTITQSPDPKQLGIVARLDSQKNLGDALKAFALFLKSYPDYVLNLYGDGADRQMLEELAASLGIADKLVFHGMIEAVDQAFQRCAFTLVTSDFEGFSLSTLESISNGTPVVSYAVNYGPVDIIGTIAGFISLDKTPESLAESMIQAVKHPKNRRQVQARSLLFSESAFLEKWQDLLKQKGSDIERTS